MKTGHGSEVTCAVADRAISGSRSLGGIRRGRLGTDGYESRPQRSADYLVVKGAPPSACARQGRYQACSTEPVHHRPDEAVSERGVRRDHARGHERVASGGEPIHCQDNISEVPVPE